MSAHRPVTLIFHLSQLDSCIISFQSKVFTYKIYIRDAIGLPSQRQSVNRVENRWLLENGSCKINPPARGSTQVVIVSETFAQG